MVLPHDACSFQGFFDGEYAERFAPNWCYEYLSRDVLPALLAGGVSQTDVDTMMITNPKKIFSKNGGYQDCFQQGIARYRAYPVIPG